MSKKSNRKLKWIIPFAVLSVTCASVGIMAGCDSCNSDKDHQHAYEWRHDETEHWKVCPADGVEEEGSRGEHVFVAGECECGATAPVVEKKYGSATGTVKLHKQGGYETDFSDVTVDMGDDVEPELNKQTGVFTVANVEVGKKYTLIISKPGYQRYEVTVQVQNENDTVTVGGNRGIILEYDVFGTFLGWDTDLHDFSHVNDANPYITFRENNGGKSFNVITNDSYNDVSATLGINFNNSTHDQHRQGMVIRFEDGKHIVLLFHYNNDSDCGIQFANALWSGMATNAPLAKDALLNDGEFFNQYGERWIHTFSSAELAAIKGEDSVDLTAVLSDGKLYVLYDGACIFSTQLPEGYENKKSQIALFAFDGGSGVNFGYNITEQLPALESALDIDVEKPDGIECTVTADPQKDKYELGEEVELTFTAPEGYKLDELTVNGVDMYNSVVGGKLTVTADRATVAVNAKFVQEQPVALNIPVKGKKAGTTAVLAQGTEVTLSGIDTPFTVDANGNISGSVVKGRYTVSVASYISKEIVVSEELTEIVLEYDLLENLTKSWGWGDESDLSKQNDGILQHKAGSGVTQWVSTKDTFDDVAISVKLLSGGGRQGVFIRFKGEKYSEDKYLMIQKENNEKISWNGEGNIWGNGTNLFHETWTNYVSPLDLENEEYTVTLVRQAEKIYVFINGVYYDVKTIDAEYADMECCVGVYCTGIPENFGEQHFKIEDDISAYFPDVKVNDGTAKDAGGTISISPEKISIGDTVVVTVTPDATHLIEKVVLSDGTELELDIDGTYKFIATQTEYTVTATFGEKPATEAEASISGIGLNNAPVTFENDTVVTFTPATGTAVNLTVKDGKVKGTLLPGTYTAAVSGYYGVEVTVGADGAFEDLTDGITLHKILFTYNFPKEGGINPDNAPSSVDYSKAASEGKLTATGDCAMYEWLVDEVEGDKAFTVTLKEGNGDQAIFASFEDFSDGAHKHGVHYGIAPAGDGYKVYVPSGEWFGGVQQNHSGAWELGTGEDYGNPISSTLLDNYKNGTLTFTLARQGSLIYVILGNQILAAYNMGGYANNNLRFAIYAAQAKTGYEIPFKLEDTSDVLAKVTTTLNSELTGYLGTWEYTEGADGARNTVSVSGRGLATFKQADTVKESLTFKLAAKNADGDQGIMYRFANGKYVAVRFQGGSNNHIQYTCDTTLFGDNYLVGWGNDFKLNEEEITAVNGDGLDITYIRNGSIFYVYAGERLLDVRKIGNEYADAKGEMSLLIWSGKGVAFEYEHKTGDDVTIPTADVRYSTNVTVKDGNAHGYDVTLDKSLVKSGESVTLTIKTGTNWGAAWSWFPSSVKVNGVEKFVAEDMVSNGANHLTYTLKLDNITENTAIEVEITKGTTITDGVIVTVKDEVGGTATCDSGKDGYYWNDGCDIYMTPAEGYEIESITVDGGTPVTSGWEYDTTNSRYVYTLPVSITKSTTVVVAYKVVETATEPDAE